MAELTQSLTAEREERELKEKEVAELLLSNKMFHILDGRIDPESDSRAGGERAEGERGDRAPLSN
jgi:hypothetical protein